MKRHAPFPLLLALACGLLAVGPVRAAAHFIPQSNANSSYVLDEAGALWAWGHNADGQLGDGTRDSRPRPQRVVAPGVTRWQTAVASRHVLAVDQSGRLWAWGTAGRLLSAAPVEFTALTNRWRQAAVTESEPLGVTLDTAGEAWVWRVPAVPMSGPLTGPLTEARPEPIPRPSGVARWTQVAGGKFHVVLLADSGRVFVFGSDQLGVLGPAGNGAAGEQFAEVPSPQPHKQWREVAAGPAQGFARLSDGEWYYWGGRVTEGGWLNSNRTPSLLRRPPTVKSWRQLAAGEFHLLLVSDDGFTYALGANRAGQHAAPPDSAVAVSYDALPVRILPVFPFAQRVQAVAAGQQHGLSLGEDGLVYTWGLGDSGQLGRAPISATWRPRPVFGEAAPFSPGAESWPRLRLVALATNVVGPVLAGQPGVTARYEIQRLGGPVLDLSLRVNLTELFPSDIVNAREVVDTRLQSLLGTEGKPLAWGSPFVLAATNSNLTLTCAGILPPLSPLPGANYQISWATSLRVQAPPWVDWEGGALAPFQFLLPQPWSVPPVGSAIPQSLSVNGTNWVTVRVSDPDGWVTGWELFSQATPGGPAELLAHKEIPFGVPKLANETVLPWVPQGSPPHLFTLVLRDQAGSVVSNQMAFLHPFNVDLAGHIAEWLTPPALELPAWVRVRVTPFLGAHPNPSKSLTLFGATTGLPLPNAHEPPVITGDTVSVLVTNAPDFIVRLSVSPSAGGGKWIDTRHFQVTRRGATPCVFMETVRGTIQEGAGLPAVVRFTRVGGFPEQGLTVSVMAHPPTEVPGPVLADGNVHGLSSRDYAPLPNVTFAPGELSTLLEIQAVDDIGIEGNEAMSLGLAASAPARLAGDFATIVITDDELDRRLPSVILTRPPARHPATRPLTLRWQAGSPNFTPHNYELFLHGESAGATPGFTRTLPAPLPVGSWTIQIRATDTVQRSVWSEAYTVEIHPELTLLGRTPQPDGTDLWQVRVGPDFQRLVLEAATEIDAWRPVQPWFITPTNRTLQVRLPAGEARFLRVVPAP